HDFDWALPGLASHGWRDAAPVAARGPRRIRRNPPRGVPGSALGRGRQAAALVALEVHGADIAFGQPHPDVVGVTLVLDQLAVLPARGPTGLAGLHMAHDGAR